MQKRKLPHPGPDSLPETYRPPPHTPGHKLKSIPMRASLTTATTVLIILAAAPNAAAAAAAAPTLASRVKGAFFGAVTSDALSLASHYEYDATKIKKYYGKLDQFYGPGEKTGGQTHGVGWGARNYHGGNGRGPAKTAGENTDYGDYNLLMLEHFSETAKPTPRRIELGELIPRWQKWLETWRSWICTQTKQTFQQVRQGVPHDRLGGMSNALAIRHAAAYAFFEDEDDIVHAARTSMFTHRETTALDGAEFFARVTHRVLHAGQTPKEAIVAVAAEPTSSAFIKRKVQQALDKVAEATDPERSLSHEEFVDDLALTSMARLWDVGKTEPIKVGKASPTEGTLPGSIYFIVKYSEGDYENPFAAAVQANAEVGGDSASRAIAIGMVLGAFQGVEAIPAKWGPGHYKEWEKSELLLSTAPLLQGESGREL